MGRVGKGAFSVVWVGGWLTARLILTFKAWTWVPAATCSCRPPPPLSHTPLLLLPPSPSYSPLLLLLLPPPPPPSRTPLLLLLLPSPPSCSPLLLLLLLLLPPPSHFHLCCCCLQDMRVVFVDGTVLDTADETSRQAFMRVGGGVYTAVSAFGGGGGYISVQSAATCILVAYLIPVAETQVLGFRILFWWSG